MTRFALPFILFAAVACGSNSSGQGDDTGSVTTGQDAVNSGQTAGSTATDQQDNSSSMGDTYEGVTCDADSEGVAWCDDDYNIVWCSDGTWWTYDCAYLGDVCAQFDDGTVDCYDDF